MKFLILLAQAHLDFRLTELKALSDFYKIDADFSSYSTTVCA